MSLLKHMKAVVLAGIAGVLVFAVGAFATATDIDFSTATFTATDRAYAAGNTAVEVICSDCQDIIDAVITDGEDVTVGTLTGSIASADVGNGKVVTITLTLDGSDAASYNVTGVPNDVTVNITENQGGSTYAVVLAGTADGNTVTAKVWASGSEGANVAGGSSVASGSAIRVTATPTTGYRVVSLIATNTLTGAVVSSSPTIVTESGVTKWLLVVSNISANVTVTGSFERIPTVSTITISKPAASLTLAKGQSQAFWAVVVTDPVNTSEWMKVTWQIDGTVTTGTSFSDSVLTVSRTETATSFSVKAVSVIDPTVSSVPIIVTVAGGDAWSTGATLSANPTPASITHNTITVNTAAFSSNPGNQAPEYAISTESNAALGSLQWQTGMGSTVFSGLATGTAYYVYARSKEQAPNGGANPPVAGYTAGAARVSSAIYTLDVYTQSDFLTSAQTVTYSAGGEYQTPKRPALALAALGKIDSIYDVRVRISGNAAKPATTVINSKSDSTVKFTIDPAGSDNNIGFVTVSAKFRGKKGTGAATDPGWYTTEDVTWVVNIGKRELTAANILVNAAVPVVYSAAAKTYEDLRDKFSVTDGNKTLREPYDYTFGSDGDYGASINRTNAGLAWIIINGAGNYSGSKVMKEFTIERAPVSVSALNVNSGSGGKKVYDGTTGIDSTSLVPKADGTAGTETNPKAYLTAAFASDVGNVGSFANAKDYVFVMSSTGYENENAGSPRTLTAQVKLLTDEGSSAKNYRFVAGNGDTATVKSLGLEIVKLDLTNNVKSMSIDSIPKSHYFNGNVRGLGTAALKPAIATKNPNVSVTYLYSYSSQRLYLNKDSLLQNSYTGDSTLPPRDAGTYGVKVRVTNGGTNISNGLVSLGNYTILPAKEPKIVTDLNSTYSTRAGRTVTLEVVAQDSNGGKLRYQWYKYGELATDSSLLRNDTLSKLTVVAGTEGEFLKYAVKVTNFFSGANPVQATTSKMSTYANITVGPPPTAMTGGFVVINPEKVWTYTGAEVKPSGSDVTVYLKDSTKLEEANYELSYSFNVNVGEATLRATGKDDYDGVLSKKFQIVKKELARSDLTFTASVPYTGEAQSANVHAVPPKTGMGAITVTYDGAAALPVNAGVYSVMADVAAGTNFTAGTDIDMGAFTISKRVPDTASFVYSIPKGHNFQNPPAKFGIGNVTVKGTGSGRVTITYNSLEESELEWEARTYTVRAEVEGGDNYESGTVVLGTYIISPTSVASANRDVPNSGKVEVAAIAPVKVVASGFTAGPSPVRNGEVIKFFSKSNVKSGSLYIFDQSGNSVAKVKASGSGEIGSWKVSTASAGSYVVKGVLIGKDGTKEKVSFVFAVTK